MNIFEKQIYKTQVSEAIKDVKETMPQMIQQMELSATIQFNYYRELVRAGFSKRQALEIVKEHGIDIGKASYMNHTDNED